MKVINLRRLFQVKKECVSNSIPTCTYMQYKGTNLYFVCVYTYIYIYIHIYIYTHTHTHIYVYIYICIYP